MTESVQAENAAQPAVAYVKKTNMPMIIYILYFAGFFLGISALAGVIMAYVQRNDSDDAVLASHYRYQIRTFWFGLLYFVIGLLTTVLLVGYLVLLFWLVWTLIRIIKGYSAWDKGIAIQ
jgi:uncharacterized membrane protein